MKLYKLLPLILIFVYTNAYGAYTGTLPKDIGTSTPLGSENPNVIDDVLRERGTIQYNLYKLKFVGTDTTLLTNDTWVVGSSSAAMLITMPAASSCANSSVTKPFVITNYSSGTITLNVSVDGVGSPTIKGSQTMSLFTDGTRWYEIRAGNAYDSDYLGGVIASGYARSGSNSDITEITGLTTYLAVGQGGSGANTAAGAASAFGVGTEDTPTLTGIVATGSSTLTTFALSNGTVSGNLGISGSVSGLEDADIPNDITLTNLTQVTTRNYNDVSGTSTISPTTATVTSARITSGTVSGTLEITGSVTGLEDADIPNTITLDNLTQVTTRNYADLSGTSTISPTTATITTINNTNFSGGSGTFTGNLQMASVTGFDYLKQWRVGSTIGTGTLAFVEGLGITLSPTYSNGNGTVTVTASGTSSAGGWTHTGTQTIGIAGSQVLPGGTLTIHADYGMTGVLDRDIPNTITLDNMTQVTTRQLADMQGLLSIATQTGGVGFSIVTGSPTANSNFVASIPEANKILVGLPQISYLEATTTTSITGKTDGQVRLLKESNVVLTAEVLLKCNNPGSTSFVDSSVNAYTVSVGGNTIGTTTAKYGSGGGLLDGTNDNITVVDNAGLTIGTNGVIGISVYPLSLADAGDDVPIMNQFQSASNYWKIDYPSQGADYKPRFRWVQNGVAIVTMNGVYNMTNTAWNDIKVTKQNGTWTLYQDGLPVRTIATTTAMIDFSGVLSIGTVTDSVPDLNAIVDNIFIDNSNTIYTGTHTVAEFSNSDEYAVYNYQYISPNTNYALMSSHMPGTYSGGASYIFNYATTTAFGYATSTGMSSVGSSNVYSTESKDAELATNFNVKSKDSKGRNFEKVTISALDKIENMTIMSWNPVNHKDMYRMDAEAIAKEAFLRQNKEDWKSLHELEYVSEIIETGTGTINVINVVAMEKGYRDYIELEWASSTEQSDWINTVEDNAESDLTMRNYGLRLDDPATPNELRKPAGIGLMDWNALNTKAIQELIAALGSATSEIAKLKAIVNP